MIAEHEHTREAIRRRLSAGPRRSYLRDWIYGGIDGAVTTFAVVSGVSGAALPARVLLVLGLANLLADGFSMTAGNYSGTKAEKEELEHARAVEHRHIRLDPGGEREEVRQILEAKGFSGADLDRAVAVITSDTERWVQAMLRDEYGLPAEVRSPLLAAGCTLGAFLACGLVPLLPFLLALPAAFPLSVAMTALVFVGIGSAKSRWSVAPWWRSGLETLAVGSAAAAIAYAVGFALQGIGG